MNAGTRVLQLRSSAGLYGAERMLLALNHGLNDDGIRSRLLCINNYRTPAQDLHLEAGRLGQEAVLLPCRGRIDARTVRALRSQIGNDGSTLLHVHDYKSAFYALLARRGKKVPIVATMHGQVAATRALRFYRRLELAMLRSFDAVVPVSDEQARDLVAAHIPETRIHRIDNGIGLPDGTAPARTREELGLPLSGYLFATVGRLSAEKNVAALLEAFAIVARADAESLLLIVGDGPERSALQAQAAQLGLGHRICFLGVRADMDRIYPLVDCLVLPSLHEGMPLVVLEAMAWAIPVVATRVGQVPALLAHSGHGLLVAPDDSAALAQAMLMRSAAPGLRDVQAQAHVRAQHSAAAMAARYGTLYAGLLEARHG